MFADSLPTTTSDARPGDLLFVYGTLQRGGMYHHLLGHARFLGQAYTARPYPLILAHYPCLLDRPGEGLVVSGELFSLPDSATWQRVDLLEDHPREYRRRLERVRMKSGEDPVAWVYFYTDSRIAGQPVDHFAPASRR